MTVLSANSYSISCWMLCSVTISILAVASSSTTTLFLRSMARHMQMSCRSPALKLAPYSVILKQIPLPARFRSYLILFVVLSSLVGCMLDTSVELLTRSNCSPADYSGSRFSRSAKPAFKRSYSMAAFVCSLKGSTLNLIVPVNRVGSYAITVTFSLT